MPRTIEEIRLGINRKFRVREFDSNGNQIPCILVRCTLKTLKMYDTFSALDEGIE